MRTNNIAYHNTAEYRTHKSNIRVLSIDGNSPPALLVTKPVN